MPGALFPLPVDHILPDLAAKIRAGARQVIVRASPGTGKTTRIPPALLDLVAGQIWVLEPRRLAAKMAALRVAEELQTKPGDLVGWQMRFDSSLSQSTRILFLTEGMFPVRIADNPNLSGVSCIILDEFHERHAQTDIAFALSQFLQANTRPDLLFIVMSATLDVTRLKERMPNAEVIDIEAPVYPVESIWWRGDPQRPLAEKMCEGICSLAENTAHGGHILGFLPGTADIVKTAGLVRRSVAQDQWDVLELRASLDRSDQERVFKPGTKRKIILATNIAESSLTIPGVTAVVDSGLARVPTFNRTNLVSTLETRPVSQASLIQRAGRAGRTAPGLVLRLYSQHDFAGRPVVDTPEILRTDLAPVLLTLNGISDQTGFNVKARDLPWLDSPAPELWQDAERLLKMLDLVTGDGRVKSPVAAKIPAHPRLVQFLLSAKKLGLTREGAWLAALLSDDSFSLDNSKHADALGCDLLAQYDIVTRNKNNPRYQAVVRTAEQLERMMGEKNSGAKDLAPSSSIDIAPLLLAAFPDRVAKARKPYQNSPFRDYVLCTGGDVRLPTTSAAAHQDWVVALQMTSSRSTGSAQSGGSAINQQAVTMNMASGITKDSLILASGDWLKDRVEISWDPNQERIRSLEQTTYGILVVDETRKTVEPSAETSALLEARLKEHWPKPFEDEVPLISFVTRQKLLQEHGLTEHAWDLAELRALLQSHVCDGSLSFADIKSRALTTWLRECVGESEWQMVESLAPSEIKVGAGFLVPIHYEPGQAPWIGARLQNFFGQMETPRILQGRVPLTVHLWAPNQRALQVTTDLSSFWQTAYPSLRNEYMRKYPRHYWPDNPQDAEPPVRGSLKPKKT